MFPVLSHPIDQDPESSNTPHQDDLLQLTSILRLRTHPAVPFPSISEIVIFHFSEVVLGLYHKAHPSTATSLGGLSPLRPGNNDSKREELNGNDFRIWLEKYLHDSYRWVQFWNLSPFLDALGKDEESVKLLLDICGVGNKGFVVRDNKEVQLYVKWLRNGDWKAGSHPLFNNGLQRNWGVIGDRRQNRDFEVRLKTSDNQNTVNKEKMLKSLTRNLGTDTWEQDDQKMQLGKDQSIRTRGNFDITDRLSSSAITPNEQDQNLCQPFSSHLPGTSKVIGKRELVAHEVTTRPLHPTTDHREAASNSQNDISKTSNFSKIGHGSNSQAKFGHSQFQSLQQVYHPSQVQKPEINSCSSRSLSTDIKDSESSPIDPKRASLAVRLQSRWKGFSNQIEEIRALEAMLNNPQGS